MAPRNELGSNIPEYEIKYCPFFSKQQLCKKGVVFHSMNSVCGRLGALICLRKIHTSIDIYIYICMSNILHPMWKYTHKGFPPTPPHPGAARRGVGGEGHGAGWVGEGLPCGYISILDIGYWISICICIYIYREYKYEYIYIYIYPIAYCLLPIAYCILPIV